MNEQAQARYLTDWKPLKMPLELVNPLAKGHKINHPPPGQAANVKFVDFDIQFDFFPEELYRFVPNTWMSVIF